MDGFEDRVKYYTVVGYIVSALSFTGYLYIANTIYELQKDFKAGMARAASLTDSSDAKTQGDTNEAKATVPDRPKIFRHLFLYHFWCSEPGDAVDRNVVQRRKLDG